MTPISPAYFLWSALTCALTVPSVLILINRWRCKKKYIYVALAVLYVLLLATNVGYWLFFGLTMTARNLTFIFSSLLCWVAGIWFCGFRDGRMVFLVLTGVLLTAGNQVLTVALADPHKWFGVIVSIVIALAEFFLLYFFGRKPYHHMMNIVKTGWLRMCLLPLVILLCLLVSFMIPVVRDEPVPNILVPLLLCLAGLMIYFVVFQMLNMQAKQQEASQGLALLTSQMHLLEQQTAQILANDNANRTFRHDMRHYISLLRGVAETGDMAAMNQVISGLDTNMNEVKEQFLLHRYTGDVIIDMVLSIAEVQAAEAGADFSVKLMLPEDFGVESTELAVVLSNALENAFDACRAMPEGGKREVRVFDSTQTGQFFLTIQNTYSGDVRFDPDTGLPLSEKLNHGYGTQSIVAFAKKYDAFLGYTARDGWFKLSLLI